MTHNLGSGTGHSVLQVIAAMEEASGKKIPHTITSRRPGDLATVIANPAKAKAELGWETKRTLQDMCSSAWNFQSQNPYGYDGPPLGSRAKAAIESWREKRAANARPSGGFSAADHLDNLKQRVGARRPAPQT